MPEPYAAALRTWNDLARQQRLCALGIARTFRADAPNIYADLRQMYHKPSAIGRFLMTKSHHLNGERPVDLLARGEPEKVRWLVSYIGADVYS